MEAAERGIFQDRAARAAEAIPKINSAVISRLSQDEPDLARAL